jgi:hypothetical protein
MKIRVVGNAAIGRFHWLGGKRVRRGRREKRDQSPLADELAKAGCGREASLPRIHQNLIATVKRSRPNFISPERHHPVDGVAYCDSSEHFSRGSPTDVTARIVMSG